MSIQHTSISGSHLARLGETLIAFEPQVPRLEAWGRRAAQVLMAGGRLLACGNGGSAEQAQHLTTELVGRYQDERQPLAALPLTHDMTAVTANFSRPLPTGKSAGAMRKTQAACPSSAKKLPQL